MRGAPLRHLSFSLRGGVAISSFIIGSIKQAKHAVGMQQKGARGRAHNVPEETGMDGGLRSAGQEREDRPVHNRGD